MMKAGQDPFKLAEKSKVARLKIARIKKKITKMIEEGKTKEEIFAFIKSLLSQPIIAAVLMYLLVDLLSKIPIHLSKTSSSPSENFISDFINSVFTGFAEPIISLLNIPQPSQYLGLEGNQYLLHTSDAIALKGALLIYMSAPMIATLANIGEEAAGIAGLGLK